MAERKIAENIKGADAEPTSWSFVTPDTLTPGAQATVQNLGTPSGLQGAPGSAGRNGIDGQDGESIVGPRGRAATLKINSVEMLDSDAEPEVENIGNETDAEYIIRLPRAVGSIPDEELIENSDNTVQSKVIQEALNLKADSSSIPTKLSDLENDRNFLSESSVEIMIEDAVQEATMAVNPVDTEMSNISQNAVQNKVINAAIQEKVGMTIEPALDDNDVMYGERVTFNNSERAISMVLTGEDIESVIIYQNLAERIPTIVSELPTEGNTEKLYLVPSGDNNYSMHIWMEVDEVEKWVNINSGGSAKPTFLRKRKEFNLPAASSTMIGSMCSYSWDIEDTSLIQEFYEDGFSIVDVLPGFVTVTRSENGVDSYDGLIVYTDFKNAEDDGVSSISVFNCSQKDIYVDSDSSVYLNILYIKND